MPVRRSTGRQRPSNSSQRETGLHMWILCDVNGIIVINKIVANGAAENEERPQKQCSADRDRATVQVHRERSTPETKLALL